MSRDPSTRKILRLSYVAGGQEQFLVLGGEGAPENETGIIGRAPDCDLTLAHESVSRRHVRIAFMGGAWVAADLDSKNGIKINTFRVRSQALEDGDCLDVGSVRLFVDLGESHSRTRARVEFHEEEQRSQHTEILELGDLESLLDDAGDLPWSRTAPSEGDAVSDLSEGLEPVGLTRLVGEAAEALLSCDTLYQTLERILHLVFDNIPAERGVICLYDEDRDITEPMVMRTREGVPDKPVRISSHIANDVIKRKQSLLVRDTKMDDRFGGAESVVMMQIHSAMCAPLYHEGRVVGFVYVDRNSPKHPFTSPQLQALTTLAMLSAVAVEQARLRDSIRHEQEMRARLARYSSPAVVERILEGEGPTQGGMVAEEREVTVLFADLAGFTPMAENMRSSEVVRMLNRVFERLTEAVFEFEGTLDKFRGDGMMAFFGAPLPQADHADRAVRAALRMQEQLRKLNDESGAGRGLSIRIGVNSGPVVVGDIGSPQRKDYTVIGDTVNTASRLESDVARPGQVVIGSATHEQLGAGFECLPLEEAIVKGKRRSVRPLLVSRWTDPSN